VGGGAYLATDRHLGRGRSLPGYRQTPGWGEEPTWHADAGELPDAVQTGGVVLAGHGETLVDVDLAPGAGVAPPTLALEGALGVHTLPKVFAGVGALRTKRTTPPSRSKTLYFIRGGRREGSAVKR